MLSGFVMWLNYAHPIAAGRAGVLREFAVARFARLYPMYLVVTLAAIGTAWALYGWPFVKMSPRAAIYFLALIQTWIPEDHGHIIMLGC